MVKKEQKLSCMPVQYGLISGRLWVHCRSITEQSRCMFENEFEKRNMTLWDHGKVPGRLRGI